MITTTATKADRVGVLRREIAGLLTRAFAMRGHAGTPALDARLLVGHAIGIAPQEVPLRDEETVSEAQRELALAHAARRAAGEPVARIVGRKEFHGLEFMLSAETLVPRPETETLVDAALAIMAPDTHATIVDIGTGTGAILLSVLAERPNALGVGVDISPGAIATAGENAARLGLAGRALFAVGDWMAAIGRADVILSNPPYIRGEDISSLDAEVRAHDPRRALDGGPDGLEAIRAIARDLGRVLAGEGTALIEIGAGQGPAVRDIAEHEGFAPRFIRDLAGIERVAVLTRR